MTNIIDDIEKKQMKEDVLTFATGDVVEVAMSIVEGKKRRIQKFEGVVIKITGQLSRQVITVRKVIDGIGVEKSYPVHSPLIQSIRLVKRHKVRKSRLYFLRERIGTKVSRLKPRD